MDKPFDYFDHDADIGIIGEGNSIEEAFIHAAQAVFAIMTDIKKIKPTKQISISFIEEDNELALVTWLNQLIGHARENSMVFCQFELKRVNNHWHGNAWGESWQLTTEHGTEVKGATFTMLEVKQINHHWHAQCVVDV